LPGVFDPRRRPWVDLGQATTAQIEAQVAQCPSGALSIERGAGAAAGPAAHADETTVRPQRNGPLIVDGPIVLLGLDGSSTRREGKTALCRCGASKSKPFCDGSHHKVGFKDD
jgi:hypothetical protein